ncbi:hypothetical protein MTO96_038261 [Rhipicephalus appendiculatus]
MVQTQMASTYPQYVTQNGGERADGKDGSFALPIVTTNGVEQQTIVKQKLSADAGAAARMRIAYLEQPGTLEARDITGTAVDKVRIRRRHTRHTRAKAIGGVNDLCELFC